MAIPYEPGLAPRRLRRLARLTLEALGLVVAALALAGCGGQVSDDDDAGAAGAGGGAALPAACEAADAGVDWSGCPDLPRASRMTTGACANDVAVGGCESENEAYFRCLALHGGACVTVHDTPQVAGYSLDSPGCVGALEARNACNAKCGAASHCEPGVGARSCVCDAPSPATGTACCWYPDCPADGSLPSCFTACSSCQ